MKLLLRWLPAILCMGLIFWFSHQPGNDLNSWLPFFQTWFPAMESFNWGHFIAYFVLCLTFYWALPLHMGYRAKLLAILLSILYGLTDEYHQQFVAGRMSDWQDIRNDAIGAVLAMIVISVPAVQRIYLRIRNGINY
ncbi:VanZ family protein [Marinicrinis sediminis]|uniref:VanZ family protein n=1 Tax=Marinicrinis sediminis TaxID=1652465 RepID=A0ABW5R5C3_9BACL